MTAFRRFLSLASATIFAAAVFLGARPASAANYAVCVGINNYKSSYCSNPLEGSVPDARHMTNLITSRGEWTTADVSFLSDSGATRTKIRQAVSNAAAKAKSGDHFLYYHSSHGGNDNYYFTTNSGKVYLHYDLDANGVKNYICSYDADYTAKMMATDLAAFPAGVKIVVMLDTCHSAGMFKYNTTAKSRKALAAKLAEAKTAAAEDGLQDDGDSAEEPAPENSISGFFMQAVLDQLRQEEADQVRRGLRPRTAASLATDVGWIAAADYDQYSWDGTDGGAFTEAFINGVTNKNKMCDNATYGNQDGYASFYEGWNYAKDQARGQRNYNAWDYDSDYGYYDYIWTDAQCTNTTVLNNVLVGWAGTNRPANVAPTFPSATATASGYVGNDVEYTFTASGSSPITYTLSSSVSSSLYDFENGYLLFTPSAAGTYTFTCTAANGISPNATCTLTVTVTEPPPATPEVPSTPSAAATTSFTATWSAVSDAASYKLYVQQKVSPATSARAARDAETVLAADFSDTTGWTLSGTGTYTGAGYYGQGSPSIKFDGTGDYAISPEFSSGTTLSFWAYGNGGSGSTFAISGLVNGSWTAIETVTIAQGAGTYEVSLPSGTTQLRFDFTKSVNCALDDVIVTGSSDTWVDIPGSPFTVSGTSKTVSGLSADTEYRYSVAAVNAAGVESEPSSYVPVTTAAGDSAPAFPASTDAADILVNGELEYTFSASGSPAPTYTLSTSVSSSMYEFDGGYLVFTPSAAGTYTFTCTAANSEGSDTCTLTVTVSAAPVTVPTLLVGDETATTAYATWDACTGVTSYTLQLASDDQFTTGGSGGEVTLFSNDATDPSAAPDGWTYNLHNTSGSYLQLMSGNYVVTEAFDASACTDLSLSLYMRTYGGTTYPSVTVEYSTDGGTTWSEPLGTLSAANTTMAERTLDVSDAAGASSVRLRITSTSTSSSVGVGIKTIVLTGTESAGDGSLISSTTVADTEYTFTGLTPFTVYYARVKGNADWSNVAEFITEEETVTDTAPSWKATFPATATVNIGEFYTLANVSSYASGSPAPTITMAAPAGVEAELAGDTFTFAAEASGDYTFTFTAANGISPDATATLVVTAVGQAPVLTASQGTAVAAVVGDTVGFTVTATGIPAPTVAMAATEYDAIFENGEFAFAPTAVGTYDFTFTASNAEGTDTLTVTVTVTAAPVTVPTLLVGDVTDTTAYATWSECTGVASYTLQLASDDQFTTGGSGGEVTLFSNDATDPSAAPDGWTYNLHNTSGSYLQLMSGNYVVTEAFDASACTDLSLSLYMRTYGGTTYPSVTVEYSTDGGTTWSEPLGTLSAANTTMAERTLDVSDAAGASSVRLRITSTSTSSSVGVGIKTIVLTGTESAGDGSLISSTTVADTEYTFTGLTPETTYFARVKGDAGWSNVEQFTTEPETTTDTAPAWDPGFPATGTVNVGEFYTLEHVSSYVIGTPPPTITLSAPAGVEAELAGDTFTFAAEASGDYTFTFTAANGISPDATATLVVTAVGQAPVLTASQGTSVAATVGDTVEFTVTATGIPAPTVTMAATEYDAVFENGEFAFAPTAVGEYAFTFTADNGEGTDTLVVTVTVSAAPVTIPTLTVTDVTDTTALATWTVCDGVTEYTLQLTDDEFPAASGASRSATPILSENFSGFSGNGNDDIASNGTLNEHTATTGWTGFKVYTASETVKVGASSGQGWLMTPALDASGTLSVVWSAYRYGTSDKNTLLLGVSANGTDFDEETIPITDEMTIYTNTFTVTGPTVYVRWMASGSSKARFYLDDVSITNPGGGGSGGDDPAGDSVQEFTVTGTSYEFTGLTPATVYAARVKGNAGWSDEVIFETLGPASTAPSIEAIADQTISIDEGDLAIGITAEGTPAPTVSVTSTDAPEDTFEITAAGDFYFMLTTVGTFHFTITAANGVSPDATTSFTVTVTGTAPSIDAIADRTISLDDGGDEFTVTAYGSPAPTFSVTSSDAPDGDYSIGETSGVFTFLAYAAGTYHFTVTAANGVSPDATTSFAVTVTAAPEPLSDYQQWLQAHGVATDTSADAVAPNEHTYWDNYIADVAPDGAFLELAPSATAGYLDVENTSQSRYYQLVYYTDILGDPETENLGAGRDNMSVAYPVDGTFFVRVRALLTDPSSP